MSNPSRRSGVVPSKTVWTLGPRVVGGSAASSSSADGGVALFASPTTRRVLRGGEPVALVLPTPTPFVRVLRLAVKGVAASRGASPFAEGTPALDVTAVRLVIKPSFPPSFGGGACASGRAGGTNVGGTSDGGGVGEGAGGSSEGGVVDRGGASVILDPSRESIAHPSSRPAVAHALEEGPPRTRSRVAPAFEEAHSNGTVLHVGLPPLSRGVAGFRVFPPDPLPRAAPWIIRVTALTDGGGGGCGGSTMSGGDDSSPSSSGSVPTGGGVDATVGGGGNHGLMGGSLFLGSGAGTGAGAGAGAAGMSMSMSMSFEPPPLPQPVPVHLGDFVVPVVRNRTPLCFDLPVEIQARRLIFESIAGGRRGQERDGSRDSGGGGGRGSGGGGGGRGAEAGGVGRVAPALSLSGRIQCYRWQ